MPDRSWKNQVICRSLIRWGLVCCLLVLMGCQPSLPQGQRVKVSKVVNGQTLEVLDINGQNPNAERVRLLGIDAPTGNQEPWSTQAKERLAALIGENKTVLLEPDVEFICKFSNGSQQKLAYVWQGNKLLNETLIEEGYVLARSYSPNTKYEQRLTYAQEKARLTGVGIWNPANPMAESPQTPRCR
jgi:micrococcal nuclease